MLRNPKCVSRIHPIVFVLLMHWSHFSFLIFSHNLLRAISTMKTRASTGSSKPKFFPDSPAKKKNNKKMKVKKKKKAASVQEDEVLLENEAAVEQEQEAKRCALPFLIFVGIFHILLFSYFYSSITFRKTNTNKKKKKRKHVELVIAPTNEEDAVENEEATIPESALNFEDRDLDDAIAALPEIFLERVSEIPEGSSSAVANNTIAR